MLSVTGLLVGKSNFSIVLFALDTLLVYFSYITTANVDKIMPL